MSGIIAIDNNSSTDLTFWTALGGSSPYNNIQERMRISTAGNVGIGTTNPTSALQVVGDIVASGTQSAPIINATTTLQVGGANINTIYASIASPTFTGTLTCPTINASTALQIGGISIATTYGKKIWATGMVTVGQTGGTLVDNNYGASAATVSTTAGVSTITLTTAMPVAKPCITATIQGATAGFITATYTDTTHIVIKTFNTANVATNLGFYFVVFAQI